MQCLNDRQLKMYIHGAIPAEDIPGTAEHIRSCPTCREKLSQLTEYKSAAWFIGDAVLDAEGCPEYEELSAYIDEILSHETHQRIEQHISMCEYCSRDIETLQAARSRASLAPQITVRPGLYAKPHQSWNIFGWKSVTAAAGSAAAITAIFLMSHTGTVVNNPIMARVPSKPTSVVAINPDTKTLDAKSSIEQQVNKQINAPVDYKLSTGRLNKPSVKSQDKHTPANTTSDPVVVAEVRDGSVTVARNAGNIEIKDNGKNLDAQIAALVEKKVKTGSVSPSFQVALAPTGALRGNWDPMDLKMSPAPNAIAESDTIFSWEPVEGASKYRVEVYEYDGTPVMHVETNNASYQPEQKLSGGFYKWRIMARRGEMAEWESSRAASFRVLSDKESSLLNRAKRNYPNSHLVLGTVYESIGLNKEAVDEFALLRAENPKSVLAAKLLAEAISKLKD